MENAVHSWEHTLKRQMSTKKADESIVEKKTWEFLQKQVQLLSLLSMNKYTFYRF
jgi:hypothetical protein